MRSPARLAATLALMLALPAVAAAQQLRGAVRDSAGGNPLAGAVVTVVDSAGAMVGRGITDAAGRFSVAAPRAARLRVIRIGFRPRDVAVPVQRDAVAQIAMERIPPMLNTVRVTGSELCPGSADRGAAFQLWEQARTGLLATVVARELRPAKATTMIYESNLWPSDERVRRQTKTLRSGQTTRPFISSASPSFFARFGYMLEDNSGRVFNAPDADVLVDESFAATHCFHLQAADGTHAGQVGLAFTPIPDRDTIVDVKGVIWLDEKMPQLRSLDFLFTSLEPAATQMRTGGHLEFRAMENGVSFIERWALRLPILRIVSGMTLDMTRRQAAGREIRRTDRFDVRVAEIVEAGGIVVEATWADGVRWRDTAAKVTGVVARRSSGEPVPAAVVTLAGTADTVRTSPSGEFEIAAIPGRYTIVASDTTLGSFVDARSESMPVDVHRGAPASVRLEVAPLDGVIAAICRGQPMRANTVMITGVVALADREVPRDARIHATWQADYVKDAITGIRIHETTQDISLDDRGRFVVCGVARERPVRLSLVRGKASVADTTLHVSAPGFAQQVLWLVRP